MNQDMLDMRIRCLVSAICSNCSKFNRCPDALQLEPHKEGCGVLAQLELLQDEIRDHIKSNPDKNMINFHIRPDKIYSPIAYRKLARSLLIKQAVKLKEGIPHEKERKS